MSAQRIIDEVHKKGGKIVSFYSICGGLPAPDVSHLAHCWLPHWRVPSLSSLLECSSVSHRDYLDRIFARYAAGLCQMSVS